MSSAAALLLAILTCDAKVVALTIDLRLDQIAPGQHHRLGEHEHLRVFYDDASVDPGTGITRVLQMQQLEGGRWVPETLDPIGMPVTDAWLDLRSKPYRYHYRAALVRQGVPVIVEFDEFSHRYTLRSQRNLAVLLSAPYEVDPVTVSGIDAAALLRPPPAYVLLNMYVILDQVAPGENSHIGDVDHMRVVYDANAIDPITRRVGILNLQHYSGGVFNPPHPDAAMMPTGDAWLDLSSTPYRLHYRAAVVHGKPILIEIDAQSRRLSIHPQQQPEAVLISGPYGFDPITLTGPEAIAAATH